MNGFVLSCMLHLQKIVLNTLHFLEKFEMMNSGATSVTTAIAKRRRTVTVAVR